MTAVNFTANGEDLLVIRSRLLSVALHCFVAMAIVVNELDESVSSIVIAREVRLML